MARMHELTLKTNRVLKTMFDEAGLYLVDFGWNSVVFMARLCSAMNSVRMDAVYGIKDRRKKDKDRFRQKPGGVLDAYLEVGQRLASYLIIELEWLLLLATVALVAGFVDTLAGGGGLPRFQRFCWRSHPCASVGHE